MEVQIQTCLEEKFIERFLNVVQFVHKEYDRTVWTRGPSSAVLHHTKHGEQF